MRAKSFGSFSTRYNNTINGTILEPGQLIYQYKSKQSVGSTFNPQLEVTDKQSDYKTSAREAT